MIDRVPLYPGRVKLEPVAGQSGVYDMVRQDSPTQAGDPLNKNTLLKDSTATLFGLGAAALPDDALVSLFLLSVGGAVVRVTVLDDVGARCPNITITGITGVGIGNCVSNADGVVIGLSNTPQTTITAISPYVDLDGESKTVSTPIGRITDINIALVRPATSYRQLTTGVTVEFSPNVASVDVCCVGGGAGGRNAKAGFHGPAADGGGGGYVTNKNGLVPVSGQMYTAIIGAGGASNANGGSTSFMGIVGAGGNGVVGNGNGGGAGDGSGAVAGGGTGADGKPGSPGTVHEFGENARPLFGGGGGGGDGKAGIAARPGAGGTPYGGGGGQKMGGGGGASGPGGGGGGAGGNWDNESTQVYYGGEGYRGVVCIRWRYKA